MLNSPLVDLPKPLAVVAHDAGGANQIIAMLQANGGSAGIKAYMEGPALILWQRAFPAHTLCITLENALEGSRSLITGTGWASNLEFDAIDVASNMGLQTAALLDHWTNYEQRFVREGRTVWPNEFWVVDRYAFTIATQAFLEKSVKQWQDYYLKTQIQQIVPPASDSEEQALLYILEPARSNWGQNRPGEFQALDYMLENLPLLSLPEGVRILLRPHPSENLDKYSDWLAQHADQKVALDNSSTLAEAISQAHWVAGCESYALVVALASGRTVYCTLPPWAPACRLPHEGLIHIKSL